MKIVKLKHLLSTIFLFVFYLSITLVLTNSMSFGLLKKTNKKSIEDNKAKSNKFVQYNEAPNKSVYFEGWIKYLHYTESEKDKPKAFFKNTYFAEQEKNPNFKGFNKNDKVKNFLFLIIELNKKFFKKLNF